MTLLGRYCAALLLLFIWGVSGRAAELEAVSMPSADLELAFLVSGRVAAVPVREGRAVKRGEALAVLDDRAVRARLRQLEAEAGSDVEARAAAKERDQKIQDGRRLEQARQKGAATELEIEYAQLEAEVAGLRHEMAILKREMSQGKLEEARLEGEEYRLLAPVDGRVEKLAVSEGEAARALEPAVRLVRLDPLWVEAHVPLEWAPRFGVGAQAKVRFPDQTIKEGEVVFVAAVADAASDTIRVRLEVPNPDPARPAGERPVVIVGQGEPGLTRGNRGEPGEDGQTESADT